MLRHFPAAINRYIESSPTIIQSNFTVKNINYEVKKLPDGTVKVYISIGDVPEPNVKVRRSIGDFPDCFVKVCGSIGDFPDPLVKIYRPIGEAPDRIAKVCVAIGEIPALLFKVLQCDILSAPKLLLYLNPSEVENQKMVLERATYPFKSLSTAFTASSYINL